MARHLNRVMSSLPPSVLMAGGALLASILLYALFVARFVAGATGALTYVAAWHIPIAVIAALLSLYAAVRHRSNLGLLLLACSVVALLFFIFCAVS